MYRLSHIVFESHWSPIYRYVVFLVPGILSVNPDCELNVRVFNGATIKGWDHGPLNESARNATTSVPLAKVVLCRKS